MLASRKIKKTKKTKGETNQAGNLGIVAAKTNKAIKKESQILFTSSEQQKPSAMEEEEIQRSKKRGRMEEQWRKHKNGADSTEVRFWPATCTFLLSLYNDTHGSKSDLYCFCTSDPQKIISVLLLLCSPKSAMGKLQY
jgi:hypothetical protein